MDHLLNVYHANTANVDHVVIDLFGSPTKGKKYYVIYNSKKKHVLTCPKTTLFRPYANTVGTERAATIIAKLGIISYHIFF